jgi:hypothetical protein
MIPAPARERFTIASAMGLRSTVAMPGTASRMLEIAPLLSSVATMSPEMAYLKASYPDSCGIVAEGCTKVKNH